MRHTLCLHFFRDDRVRISTDVDNPLRIFVGDDIHYVRFARRAGGADHCMREKHFSLTRPERKD